MPTFSQSNYRWTSQFFREDLPLIPRLKRKVLATFERYSGLSGENLRTAFLSGYEPSVKVEHLPGLYGYTPPLRDGIQLARIFIEELEAALPANRVPRGQVYEPTELEEKALLILEVTVLHEMVHYFRRSTGLLGPTPSHEEAKAQQFEKAAYGIVCTVQSLSVAKYFPRTAATASK